MSEWYKAEGDDIEIDGQEVNIRVTNNDSGNIYVTLTFEQVKKLYDEIKGIKEK